MDVGIVIKTPASDFNILWAHLTGQKPILKAR